MCAHFFYSTRHLKVTDKIEIHKLVHSIIKLINSSFHFKKIDENNLNRNKTLIKLTIIAKLNEVRCMYLIDN